LRGFLLTICVEVCRSGRCQPECASVRAGLSEVWLGFCLRPKYRRRVMDSATGPCAINGTTSVRSLLSKCFLRSGSPPHPRFHCGS
jgi:hypothetical protein